MTHPSPCMTRFRHPYYQVPVICGTIKGGHGVMRNKQVWVPSMHGSDSGLSDVGARWVVGGGTVGGVPWVARSVVDTVIRWYGGRYGGTAGDTACCATRMYASDSVPWLGV